MTQKQQPVSVNDIVEPAEENIRLRSYLIWEREGKPQDNAIEHWQRAKAELLAETKQAAQPPKAEPVVQTEVKPAVPPQVAAKSGKKSGGAKRQKVSRKIKAKRNHEQNEAAGRLPADNIP